MKNSTLCHKSERQTTLSVVCLEYTIFIPHGTSSSGVPLSGATSGLELYRRDKSVQSKRRHVRKGW